MLYASVYVLLLPSFLMFRCVHLGFAISVLLIVFDYLLALVEIHPLGARAPQNNILDGGAYLDGSPMISWCVAVSPRL